MSFSGLYLTRVWLGSNFSEKFLPSKIRPLAAHVKLTENCQAKCISCDYWKTRWHDGIKADRAVELLNEIGAAGIRSLRFTGGEPLLRTDLFEIMRRADMRPFSEVILQTNGLLIKKMHKEINASAITKVCISIDGLEETNDLIRGIDGYFDLAMQGIKLLRGKKVSIAVTLNRISAKELGKLAEVAHGVGAEVQYNVLSQSIYFIKDADMDSMWPEGGDVKEIAKFLRDDLKRPEYEVEYVTKYFKRQLVAEPPCISGLSSDVRAIKRRRDDRMLSAEAGRKHSEGHARGGFGIRGLCAAVRGHGAARMSGLHVRRGKFAGDAECGFQRVF